MSDVTGDPGSETLPGAQPTVSPSATAPTLPTTPPVSQEPTDDDDIFDKDRAMATIRKLREEAKAATKAIKELDTLRAERKAAEDAKLSEQERREARIKQLEAEIDFEKTEKRDRINRYEVQLQAQRLGIVDPDAAVKLLDWDGLDYDDDGNPREVEKALKALVKDRPYLAGQAGPATSPTNGATRPLLPGQRIYSRADLSDYAFYQAHRDDIQAAYREGRIEQ